MFYPYREKRREIKDPKKDRRKFPGYIESIAETLKDEGCADITSDVTGSYTGMTIDGDAPVQDADDL